MVCQVYSCLLLSTYNLLYLCHFGMENFESEKQRPKVGVGVIILKEGKVLLAKRKGSHSAGVWGSCGGHMEFMESFEDCARRETFEEAGIEIENLRFLCVTNFRTNESKHYVDIGFVADWKSGEPTIKEPDRQEEWGWYELDALPEPIFSVLNNYFEAHRTGRTYFDA